MFFFKDVERKLLVDCDIHQSCSWLPQGVLTSFISTNGRFIGLSSKPVRVGYLNVEALHFS